MTLHDLLGHTKFHEKFVSSGYQSFYQNLIRLEFKQKKYLKKSFLNTKVTYVTVKDI